MYHIIYQNISKNTLHQAGHIAFSISKLYTKLFVTLISILWATLYPEKITGTGKIFKFSC